MAKISWGVDEKGNNLIDLEVVLFVIVSVFDFDPLLRSKEMETEGLFPKSKEFKLEERDNEREMEGNGGVVVDKDARLSCSICLCEGVWKEELSNRMELDEVSNESFCFFLGGDERSNNVEEGEFLLDGEFLMDDK
jgi:hypothetical protein